jgi:hypothetical protein
MNTRLINVNIHPSNSPLEKINTTLDDCHGVIILGFERKFLVDCEERWERKGVKKLERLKLPTVWNHIEAAMAYSKSLPLLVIIEDDILQEGLLEHCFEWFVYKVNLNDNAHSSDRINGLLLDFKERIENKKNQNIKKLDYEKISFFDLLKQLKISSVVAIIVFLSGLATASFSLSKYFPGLLK